MYSLLYLHGYNFTSPREHNKSKINANDKFPQKHHMAKKMCLVVH